MQPWQGNQLPPLGDLIRVSQRHVKEFKELWLRNGWKCGICGQPFTMKDGIVVDHSHETGVIRGCLHNTCNRVEGELLGFAKRVAKDNPEDWLLNVCLAVQAGQSAGKNISLITKWCHKGVTIPTYMVGLHNYLTWYKVNRTRMIHPNHRFPNEGGSDYKKHNKQSLRAKRGRRR